MQGRGGWTDGRTWRHGLAVLLLGAPLAILLALPPFVEPAGYFDFADQRAFLGIANFMDVASNLPFLLVGVAGVRASLDAAAAVSRRAWIVFFSGVALVSLGSAYFHWNPTSATVIWDRLPMVTAFGGLTTAVLAENVDARLARLLVPTVVLGAASVLYGYWHEDLRLYLWIQLLPLLAVVAIFLYPRQTTHRGYLLLALGCYVLAKAAEIGDRGVLELTAGVVSGHTIKHLAIALGVWYLAVMVRRRSTAGAVGG